MAIPTFTPGSPMEIINFQGTAIGTKDLQVVFKNYNALHPEYVGIQAEVEIVPAMVNGAQVSLFTISGNGYPAPVGLTPEDLTKTWQIDFTEATNKDPNDYYALIRFNIYGTTLFSRIFIESIEYTIHLKQLGIYDILEDPIGLVNFSHVKTATLPAPRTKKIYVSGNFTIDAGKHISLSGGNLTYLYTVDDIKTYGGSETQTINISLDSSINTEQQGEHLSTITVRNTQNTHDIGVRIRLYNQEEVTVRPNSLHFMAIKTIREAEFKTISIDGIGSYTISLPVWMETTGPLSANAPREHQVRPVASSELAVGIYTGEITINHNGNIVLISVTHQVIASINPGFRSDGSINFTHDRNLITDIYGSDDQKIILTTTTTFEDFEYPFEGTRSGVFTKTFFKNKTDFWVGSVVNKIMPALRDLAQVDFIRIRSASPSQTQELIFYPNPSTTQVQFQKVDRETEEPQGDPIEFNTLHYLKGRRPDNFTKNIGIVDFFTSPIRVTRNSVALLTIFNNMLFSKITVFRNGYHFRTIYPDQKQKQLFALAIEFAEFTPGDFISFGIDVDAMEISNKIIQEYIVFPDGKHSYHIAWVTEHNVLQMMEFTGDYKFLSEHKGVTTQVAENYLEQTVKVASERKLKFVANTGWILKSNSERIDSLVDANTAWLIFADRDPIKLIPADAKITNVDSEQETYEYNVEFNINPQHELENPSF